MRKTVKKAPQTADVKQSDPAQERDTSKDRHYYPTPKQQLALTCPHKTIFFGGSRGGGQALSVDSLCLTPFGFRRMGDIQVGDIISDIHGSNQRVIYKYPQGVQDLYRVKFIDGASVLCTLDHLWTVKRTCHRSKKRKYATENQNQQDFDWKVMTFGMIKDFFDAKESAPENSSIKKQNLLVPLSEPVNFTKSYKVDMRPIDPYALGVIIGDGGTTGGSVMFTTADNEIVEQMEKHYEIKKLLSKYGYSIKSDNIKSDLKKLKLLGKRSEEKFIPESYKLSSVDKRISIIQGLFDTDGTVDDRGHVSYCTTSKQLAIDVQWIIRSLGGKATITESPSGYRKENGEYVDCLLSYDVYVNTKMNSRLFRLSRKIARCKDGFNGGVSELHRRIIGYEYAGKGEAVCIKVSNPDGLFVTDDFIVTHNSFCCCCKIMQHAQMYGKNARIVFMRRSLKELEQFIDRCKTMFEGIAVWKEQKKRFEFKNGAICDFNYLEGESVKNYMGQEFTLIILDEVGEFDSYDDIRLLKGSMRSSAGVPTQLFMTGNPGGRLHNILKAEFIDPAPKGMKPIPDTDPNGNPLGTYRIYIPSTLFENPHLMENDPNYLTNLMQLGSPEMVRAWIKGDWNIISGGAFDKLFDRNIHIIKPFRIPSSWRIIECYDDGLTKPAACLWFAISDGSDYYLPNGEVRSSIRGDIFCIAEMYFWTGKPNEGSAESTPVKAEKILRKEKALGYEISQRIADSAIFSSRTHSTADEFEENGLYFERCNKAPGCRIHAANMFRNRLMGALERSEEPGIFFFNTCIQTLRTIPTLPRDKKETDDVDSKAEDHCFHGDTIIHTLEYGSVPIRELVGKTGHCLTAGGYYAAFNNCKCFEKNAPMMKIKTEDAGEFVCMPDHKILTDKQKYSEGSELKSLSFRKHNNISTVKVSGSITHIEFAKSNGKVWSAETALSATNTLQKKPAPGYVAGSSRVIYARKAKSSDAYCLSVDATHSVVVNDGLVVANCYDCISYLLLSDYDAEVQYGDAGNI